MSSTESLAVPQVDVAARVASPYSVSITMDGETVTKLHTGGFRLLAFKAVQTPRKGGAPLVWVETENYSLDTKISWEEDYQAYTSKTDIKAGVIIEASASYEIDLGQALNVTGIAGTGEVFNDGTGGTITIRNKTEEEFTCGIKQKQEAGKVTMLCAFPLFGNNVDKIVPLQKVLLMFATGTIRTGTVLFQAISPGVLIDLTAKNERAVNYHRNTGWSWGGGAWGQSVKADEDLVSLLIEP